MNKEELVLFVYSEMHISKEKEINHKIGKNFICGEVVIGSQRKQYSKIITENQLSNMLNMYPDTKIIYKGKKSETVYTDIKSEFLK